MTTTHCIAPYIGGKDGSLRFGIVYDLCGTYEIQHHKRDSNRIDDVHSCYATYEGQLYTAPAGSRGNHGGGRRRITTRSIGQRRGPTPI